MDMKPAFQISVEITFDRETHILRVRRTNPRARKGVTIQIQLRRCQQAGSVLQ